MARPGTTECEECDGAGEFCPACGKIPDNCDCEGIECYDDCPTCHGNGFVDADTCGGCGEPEDACECDEE